MKKILALLLAVVLAAGLIGCAREPEATEPTVPATMAPPEPVKKTVHILLPEAMASEAMEIANLFASADCDSTTVTYSDAEQQTRLLAELAAQSKGNGSDVVVTMPLSADMDDVFSQLVEANVSYALADLIPTGAKAASVANVYYDQYAIGAAAAAYLTEKGLTQDDKVVILQGISEEEAQRTDGFQQYLQGKLAWDGAFIETPWESLDNIVYSDMQGTSRTSAAVYFETYMSESDHADTRYIAAWEDEYVLGILDALEDESIDSSVKEKFLGGNPVMTGCGGNEAMRNVLMGTSSYTTVASFGEIRTVWYSRALLNLAAQAMADHLAGSVVEQDQPQPITWLTAENVTQLPIEG